MSEHPPERQANSRREIVTPDGHITVPPGSPKILIHTRQGRCVGIYCDHPAKVLTVETKENPENAADPRYLQFVSVICPQTSVKLVGGCTTTIDHVLAMAFDDPSMDEDLCEALDAHEVILEEDWPDIW